VAVSIVRDAPRAVAMAAGRLDPTTATPLAVLAALPAAALLLLPPPPRLPLLLLLLLPALDVTLATMCCRMRFARAANASVHSVSGASAIAGETVHSSSVRAEPPRQSLSAYVSMLSRYGMCTLLPVPCFPCG
jgi:hypothetical protein